MLSDEDVAIIAKQLGRPPRNVVEVSWRCSCQRPGVIKTEPRLDNGTPFPTTYYLTCPQLISAVSRLEASGVMTEMTHRLDEDNSLARQYLKAHESYLADRAALGEVPELEGISAGGMPSRVKCLHALVGHALAKGPGVNPFGDEALALLGDFVENHCAVELAAADPNSAVVNVPDSHSCEAKR